MLRCDLDNHTSELKLAASTFARKGRQEKAQDMVRCQYPGSKISYRLNSTHNHNAQDIVKRIGSWLVRFVTYASTSAES
jgi:hypothetical protein